MAVLRKSLEEQCVLCEVLTLSRAITTMTVSVSVFVFRSNNDCFHVLKLTLVIVTWTLCSWLDTRKDKWVHSAGNNCWGTTYNFFFFCLNYKGSNFRYIATLIYCRRLYWSQKLPISSSLYTVCARSTWRIERKKSTKWELIYLSLNLIGKSSCCYLNCFAILHKTTHFESDNFVAKLSDLKFRYWRKCGHSGCTEESSDS
jgi:hypothetical protein